jgi:hypothetical protein
MTCSPRRTGGAIRAGPGEADRPWPCGPPPVTGSMIAAVTDDLRAMSRPVCGCDHRVWHPGRLGHRVIVTSPMIQHGGHAGRAGYLHCRPRPAQAAGVRGTAACRRASAACWPGAGRQYRRGPTSHRRPPRPDLVAGDGRQVRVGPTRTTHLHSCRPPFLPRKADCRRGDVSGRTGRRRRGWNSRSWRRCAGCGCRPSWAR